MLNFTAKEKAYPDISTLPVSYLLKTVALKVRRRLFSIDPYGKASGRLVWSVSAVSDAEGPTANVRNYLEHNTLRAILSGIGGAKSGRRMCDVGCGYGRMTIVLQEFADTVVGYEREGSLLDLARPLAPAIDYRQVDDLATITDDTPFDFAMISTVLQHLTDDHARAVCAAMRALAPNGHVLLIEKTDDIATTDNTDDGSTFISKARTVETYAEFMAPYELVDVRERILEPTYFNPSPGQCMLFKAPASGAPQVP